MCTGIGLWGMMAALLGHISSAYAWLCTQLHQQHYGLKMAEAPFHRLVYGLSC